MPTVKILANYYQQFDANHDLAVPAEAYGGWKKAEIEISREHTAVVVMHAWDCGTREQFPGWWRAVEYIPRSHEICRTVFPPILSAVREAKFNLFHVVGGGDCYKSMAGYKLAVELAGDPKPRPEAIQSDPVLKQLQDFRFKKVFYSDHNKADIERGFKNLDFPKEARPQGDEPIAENSDQLFAVCKKFEVNHLIYMGFAINWCLLLSSGGMADMSRRGLMCSAIRQATTAVENKETARKQLCKEIGLWRVALAFGFVFDAEDLIAALKTA